MKKLLVLVFLLLLAETLARKGGKGGKGGRNKFRGQGKGRRGKGKHGQMKGKKDGDMMMDACVAVGHPCMLGQECVVSPYNGEERCVCVRHCPDVPNAEVCGGDMKTYHTACHLYQMNCEMGRHVNAIGFGPCELYNKKHLKIEPASANGCEMSRVNFKCLVDKTVEKITHWKKDGKVLATGDNIMIQDNTLVVSRVGFKDVGNYTCVTMGDGIERMANATLHVTSLPFATIPEQEYSCESGESVQIPCIHDEDSEISWMQNGFEVQYESNMVMDNTGMLIMKRTKRENAGTYTCMAKNFCGVMKAECNVDVKNLDHVKCPEGLEQVECPFDPCLDMECDTMPGLMCKATVCGECGYKWVDEEGANATCPEKEAPQIVKTQLVSLTPEGDDAIVPCEATGYPKPNITWTLDGESVVGLKKHSLRGNTLVIRQLVLGKDNGRYTCTASNEMGSVSSSIVIAILPRMSPKCGTNQKIMRCEIDYCADAVCPAHEHDPSVTCINTVCNVCTYIFVDRYSNYVDCYADPAAAQMAAAVPGYGSSQGMPAMQPGMLPGSQPGQAPMPGWPAGVPMPDNGMGHAPIAGFNGDASYLPGMAPMGNMGDMGHGAVPAGAWPAGSSMPGSMGGGHGAMPAMGAGAGMLPGSLPGVAPMPGWPAGVPMPANGMGHAPIAGFNGDASYLPGMAPMGNMGPGMAQGSLPGAANMGFQAPAGMGPGPFIGGKQSVGHELPLAGPGRDSMPPMGGHGAMPMAYGPGMLPGSLPGVAPMPGWPAGVPMPANGMGHAPIPGWNGDAAYLPGMAPMGGMGPALPGLPGHGAPAAFNPLDFLPEPLSGFHEMPAQQPEPEAKPAAFNPFDFLPDPLSGGINAMPMPVAEETKPEPEPAAFNPLDILPDPLSGGINAMPMPAQQAAPEPAAAGMPAMGGHGAMPMGPGMLPGSLPGVAPMPGWPAGVPMPANGMGHAPIPGYAGDASLLPGMAPTGNMGMMDDKMMAQNMNQDKYDWHMVPGWAGHMSQKGQYPGQKAAAGGRAAAGGDGHLNVFYSGKPDDEEDEDEN